MHRLLRCSSPKRCVSLQHRSLSSSILDGKVLIANRGEIACRIIKTCRRLGIPTVAVYSQADGRHALHAQMADEAYLLGTGASPSESYLLGDEMLTLSHKVGGIQAIHPGYGFLSENASFCQRVTDEGFLFVGPSAGAISAMGSKSESKQLMKEAGVSITPGHHGDEQDAEYLLDKAVSEVGFPLLIKAVSGGGGKGMRIVQHESEFLEALESCQREARSSFGDASVLLEKYLHHPRHVEVQILADQHGNVVHLHERDCSLQRRHQKIIEEAPASYLDDEFRAHLGEMGCQAAKAVNYVNAGTVEFLLDGDPNDSSTPLHAYFCEMNTRLQVEHPITELITGLDLVEWQLRIAAGQRLPSQEEIAEPKGHAFEARVYAETLPDFLPATGPIWHHQPPEAARTDTGLQAGMEISVHYDPMISKLICHGSSRQEALQKLILALGKYELAGVPTNIDFLIQCAQHEVFQQAGGCHTGFLDLYLQNILDKCQKPPTSLQYAVSTVCHLLHQEERIDQVQRSRDDPWSSSSGSWRMGGPRRLNLTAKDVTLECVCHRDGSYDIGVSPSQSDGKDQDWFHLDGAATKDGTLSILVDGAQQKEYSFFRQATQVKDDGAAVFLWSKDDEGASSISEVWFSDPVHEAMSNIQDASSSRAGGHGLVAAPMPGKVVQVNARMGQEVVEGDVLVVMEAMKMEHKVKAPRSGVVMDLSVALDQIVDEGHVFAIVATNEEEATQEAV